MCNDAVFTEGVIDSAGQRQSVGLLNEILVLFCRSLAGLRIFSEVVIVDLAVLLDNALQAGFFLDDAAVEPIGIISDAVNTGNIFLEHTLAVKDAAGFFRCSIGDQRRDSGSRVSGFGVQIVGIAVNDGPTSLLQFAVLVVLSALLALKPAGRARDHFAFCDKLITNRAIRIAGVTGCRKRCFDRIANLRLVAGRRDYLLFNKHFLANITVLALRQAGLGAGRRDCGVNDLGMSLGGDHFLRNKDFVADRAVLALGLAGFGASRLNCRINDLGMSLGGDHFLRNKDFVADRAVLTLGQTSLRAGRSLCYIDYFCVAGRRDFFHTGEDCLTNGALRTGLMAGLGAGGRFFGDLNRRVAGRADCFGLGCIANCAGVGLDTGVLTGRGGRDLALIPSVALGGNLFLRFDNRSADRAVRACGLAGRGAGRLDGRVNDLGVSLGVDDLAFLHHLVADGAVGVAGVAGRCAGGALGTSHLSARMAAAPLGVEGGVRRQGDVVAICIGGAAAVGCGIPAVKRIVLAGERVGE